MWQADPMSRPQPITVSALTARIKQLIERNFTEVVVIGEVSRLTRAASGHLYFTIKDAGASLSAVIWRTSAARLSVLPREGAEFIFTGHISVYEPRGSYQLIVRKVEPSGIGRLAELFERRKREFAARGWFAPERKRTPPRLPRRIAVVTSPTAAAFEDVRKVLASRPGWLEIYLFPCLVQGEEAPATIARAMARAGRFRPRPDVLLLVRGGGSVEDLWCFNDEAVVRAVVESPIPVISGIGHEIDTTLADFAADLRAATPSNAAELACPSREELRRGITRPGMLARLLAARIDRETERRNSLAMRLEAAGLRRMDRAHADTMRLFHALQRAAAARLALARRQASTVRRRLMPLEPRRRLARKRAATRQLRERLVATSPRLIHRLERRLADETRQLQTRIERLLGERRERHRRIDDALIFCSETLTARLHQRLARSELALRHAAGRRLAGARSLHERQAAALNALDPTAVLGRGYSLTLDAEGRAVRDASRLRPGDRIVTRFAIGRAESEVRRILKEQGS